MKFGIRIVKKLLTAAAFSPKDDLIWGHQNYDAVSAEYCRSHVIVLMRELRGQSMFTDFKTLASAIRCLVWWWLKTYEDRIPTNDIPFDEAKDG